MQISNSDQNYILTFPDDDLSSEKKSPSGKTFRRIISLIMIIAMLLAFSYVSIFPWLEEVLQGDFSIVLTSVSAPKNGKCSPPSTTLQQALLPTRSICICGRLYNKGITYTINLKDVNGNRVIQDLKVKDQSQGTFCHRMNLEEILDDGRYLVDITSGLSSQPKTLYRFSIRSKKDIPEQVRLTPLAPPTLPLLSGLKHPIWKE